VTLHGSKDEYSGLDFTKPEVVRYAEDTLAGLINRYKLDVFRLDYNWGVVACRIWLTVMSKTPIGDTTMPSTLCIRAFANDVPTCSWKIAPEVEAGTTLACSGNAPWTQISDVSGAARELRLLNGVFVSVPS